jgi:N-acetylglutamate synthase-like GNAT family acetyltransferase
MTTRQRGLCAAYEFELSENMRDFSVVCSGEKLLGCGAMHFCPPIMGEVPLKAWKDCLRCPKFQNCDEIAVLRVLNTDRCEQDASVFLADRAVYLPAVRTTTK